MRATEFIAEVNRRDFLKSIGAGMMAAGAGSALYDKLTEPEDKSDSETKNIDIKPITDSPLERLLLDTAKREWDWTPEELAQFMAQCAHETMGFKTLEEIGDDKKFRRKYGSERWKGRGFIQLTGRDNYRNFNLSDNPEVAADPKIAASIAGLWWKNNVAPRITNFNNTTRVTRLINGPGMYGLNERDDYFNQYLDAWNVK
jgi:hypothetical protein